MSTKLSLIAATAALLAVEMSSASARSVHSEFRSYPAFRGSTGRVEAIHDKGLMLEIIVKCNDGAGIITASKVEGLFCGPKHKCTKNLKSAVQQLCGISSR